MTPRTIKKGIYLVIDPSMEESKLWNQLDNALRSQLCAIQILDGFQDHQDPIKIIEKVCQKAHQKGIPVLINNQWAFLKNTAIDGVHFDELPIEISEIRAKVGRSFLIGVTCGNDIDQIRKILSQSIDYLSFCSIFPSSTQNSCELVSMETIQAIEKMATIPIFLAGGITPENLPQLSALQYEGIAVVSGIMNAEIPEKAIQQYIQNSNLQL